QVPRRTAPQAAGPASGTATRTATGTATVTGTATAAATGTATGTAEEPAREETDESRAATTLRSVAQTVRVDIRKLDHLMNVVGELAIVRSAVARLTERVRLDAEMRELATSLNRLHRSFDRHLSQMQNGILEVRMVPLGQVFD